MPRLIETVAPEQQSADIDDEWIRPGLEDDPRWQTAKRVAASKRFEKSRFLSAFLLYVCEKHLLDKIGEITEPQIGEQVFCRAAGYNPAEDNIVRNYARLLRQRLDEYFTTGEGLAESIRIVIPRGGYVPLFVERDELLGETIPSTFSDHGSSEEEETPISSSVQPIKEYSVESVARLRRKNYLNVVLLVLCAVLSIGLAISLFHNQDTKTANSPLNRFWSHFFDPSRDTLLVPADSGLAIYQDLTHRHISLAEYVRGDYVERPNSSLGVRPAIVADLGTRRYTSVVDLHLVSTIAQLPFVVRDRFKVRYAREVQLDDLKESNVILLGGINSNPWTELFQKDMNFRFERPSDASDLVIHNLHPHAGEKEYYQTDNTDPARSTYGVIAVTANLSGTGHLLLVEGINMAGTEAAADYLLSEAATPLLQQVFDSHGELRPFEALIETSNIGANAPRPQIISERIHSEVSNEKQ
jgi:hypothetical protein